MTIQPADVAAGAPRAVTSAGLAALRADGLDLDATPEAVGKLLARYHLFQRILAVPGDIVEAGVYRGAGLFLWASLLELFAPRSRRKVIGFDTFTGFPDNLSLPADRGSVDRVRWESGAYAPRSAEQVRVRAEELGVAHRVELVPGNAVDTIPAYVEDRPGLRIALLHLDFDVYEPTRAALATLCPLVVRGGIVVLDQYGSARWGESNAVDEFVGPRGLHLERLPWGSGPKAYFVQP